MNLDGTTITAVLGFFGLIVTTVAGVYIATRTNKAEKESSAQKALEETRDEVYEGRIKLRDEIVAQLRSDLADCRMLSKLRIEELESENDALHLENRKLKGS